MISTLQMPKQSNPSDKFLNAQRFSEAIEHTVKQSNGMITYIDAIVAYCEDNNIEVESVPKLLSKPLKEKIKYQAQSLNLVKRTSRGILPL